MLNFEFKSTHSEVTMRVPNPTAATIYSHSELKINSKSVEFFYCF